MMRTIFLLCTIASSVPGMGQATTACPWLSTGTAANLLGGDITVSSHVEGTWAGSCRFMRLISPAASSIEVLVGPKDTHPCPQGNLKLPALGNGAVQCTHTVSPSQPSSIIAGRIRDVYFVITMTGIPGAMTPEPSDPRLADAFAASPLERVAEQVVGNLY